MASFDMICEEDPFLTSFAHPLLPAVCTGKADQHMKSELPLIIEFANSIGRDPNMDELVVRNCVNLLGDICTVVTNVGPLLQQARSQDWEKLLNYCHDSDSIAPDTDWAVQAVTTAVQSAG